MRIAYLVFAYKNPQLLERAIMKLSSDECAFFIHIDQKSNIGEFSRIQGDNIFFSEKRIPVYWGEFSGVEAILLLIRQALESGPYDYCVLLSGSEYPLKSSRYIHSFLEHNQGSEFIALLKMPSPGKPISRINTVRFESDKPLRRLTWRLLAKMGLAQRDYRQYLGGLEPYSGITWWALSRMACEYVVRFTKENPQVAKFFRNTFSPEETFIHTILGNSPLRDRVRGHLVFEEWANGSLTLESPSTPMTKARLLPQCVAFLTSRDIFVARLKGWKTYGANCLFPQILTDEHVARFEAQEKVWLNDVYGRREALFARRFSDDKLDLLARLDEMMRRKAQAAEHLPVETCWYPESASSCRSVCSHKE
jgi:hypothetical protein